MLSCDLCLLKELNRLSLFIFTVLLSDYYYCYYFIDEESVASNQEIGQGKAASIELQQEWKPGKVWLQNGRGKTW